jgi:small subunit ribosomal protein S6
MDNNQKNAYECMFIVNCAAEDACKATVNKFVSLIAGNGETIDVADWGTRRLEYPINDMNEGYYEVVTFRSEPEFPSELERLLNIDENVMRSLILRLDEEVAEKVARRAADRAAAAVAAAEAAAAAAAAAEAEAAAAAAEAEKEEPAEQPAEEPAAEPAADAVSE